MAKLLGQEIVTQAEFDEFKVNSFEAHSRDIAFHTAEIESIKKATEVAEKAELFAKIAAFLSAAALIGMGLLHFAK